MKGSSSAMSPAADFVALDDALEALAKFDERKSRVIELRFFGGLSVEETAAVLKVSPATVMGDWRLAKAMAEARDARRSPRMTPERLKRTEKLYYAAGALPPDERGAFLADACGDDEALRRDVESLLNESLSDAASSPNRAWSCRSPS